MKDKQRSENGPGEAEQLLPKKHLFTQDAQAKPDASRHSRALREMKFSKRRRETMRRVLCWVLDNQFANIIHVGLP